MAPRVPVIAIDGPVGTGKGTLSQLLANRLGFSVLDSGAIYRLLGLAAQRRGIRVVDEPALVDLAGTLEVSFAASEGNEPVRVMLGREDVTEEIRSERCAAAASQLAARPPIRQALLDLQRSFRRSPGLVADGRDMGTVVFPDADVKIFLTATADERARRRHKQLIGKGIDVNLAQLLADINRRDGRDRERMAAPLKPAEGAIVIDTTGLEIGTVLNRVIAIVSDHGLDTGSPEGLHP